MKLIEEKKKKILSLTLQIDSLEYDIKCKKELLSEFKIRKTKIINELFALTGVKK